MTLAWLADRGIRPVAAIVDAATDYTDADLTGPLAIVLGQRGRGSHRRLARPTRRTRLDPDGRYRRQPERLDCRGRDALRGGPATSTPGRPATLTPWRSFDFIVIGAGPAGEAAAYEARSRGASVAVIDRRWFGGSCPHIGCLPSKSLLHGAAEHAANPERYSWQRASAARDFMVNRPADADGAGRLVARPSRSRKPARSAIAGRGRSSAGDASRSATTGWSTRSTPRTS